MTSAVLQLAERGSVSAAAMTMRVAALVGASIVVSGCAPGPQVSRVKSEPPAAESAPAGQGTSSQGASPRPVALANGEAIMPAQLETRLREMAGPDVLDELVLESALREALRARGLSVTEGQSSSEEQLFIELLGGDEPGAVLAAFRSRRGMGDVRWKALLWRNAALRALTAPDVRVPASAAEQLHAIRHGERRVVRLIAVRTAEDLASVRAALESGDRFESVALAQSIDPSASLGGLIGPVSVADPAIPPALRKAVSQAAEGAMTEPIMLPGSIVIARVERVLPADDVSLELVRTQLEREALLRAQRAAMDSLAARLRSESRVTVIDPTLERR